MSRKSVAHPIKTENAGIGTASVNIRILQVNKKQMTLAVFRQIPIEDFHDADGDLRDDITLWGSVRYTIDHCDNWAVASADGNLIKTEIYSRKLNEEIRIEEEGKGKLKKKMELFNEWVDLVRDNPGITSNYILREIGYKSAWQGSSGDEFHAGYYRDDLPVVVTREGINNDIISRTMKDYHYLLNICDRDINKLRHAIDTVMGLRELPQIFIAV